jgi:hypothetical protein
MDSNSSFYTIILFCFSCGFANITGRFFSGELSGKRFIDCFPFTHTVVTAKQVYWNLP